MYRTALARTHRPRRFADLVGQDHVSSTLRAAVEGGRVAHAYLFSGPRGIGKTTAARVLAMALNCADRVGGEPCGQCDSCRSIWSGRTSLDVVEIDAASNRGVEDARDLRERAMYAPSDEKRYKVYIVDEAHMLTREAWNALLKILEEPPPRVIFVFATTDPQKIRQSAEPVMSRCQRFDFHRVSVSQLVDRLKEVLELEGVSGNEEALLPIARRAEGGVRDALSLLDQVLSFSGDTVEPEDVHRMLGLVEEELYLDLLHLIRDGDRAGVFPFVQGLLDEGYDLAEFVQGLGDVLRAVLALRLDPTGDQADLSGDSRERLRGTGAQFSEEELLRLLVAVADFESAGRFRRSAQPRIQVEVLLLRLASLDSSLELKEILEVIGQGSAATEDRYNRRGDRREAKGGTGRTGPADLEASGRNKNRSSEPRPPRPAARQTASGPNAEAEVSPAIVPPVEARTPADLSPDIRIAWGEALEAARGTAPGGQLVGLRGAVITRYADGALSLQVPAGLARDLGAFLDDPARSKGIRTELSRRLGGSPESLAFRIEEAGAGRRITAESARDQKLTRMVEADPRLREAVETLDLELTEE